MLKNNFKVMKIGIKKSTYILYLKLGMSAIWKSNLEMANSLMAAIGHDRLAVKNLGSVKSKFYQLHEFES